MRPIDDSRPEGDIEEPQTKRPYATPRLVPYGDFRRLTSAKNGGQGDGSMVPKTRM
jgi:hypothetical protein